MNLDAIDILLTLAVMVWSGFRRLLNRRVGPGEEEARGRLLQALGALRQRVVEEEDRRKGAAEGRRVSVRPLIDLDGLAWEVIRAAVVPELTRIFSSAVKRKLSRLWGDWYTQHLEVTPRDELGGWDAARDRAGRRLAAESTETAWDAMLGEHGDPDEAGRVRQQVEEIIDFVQRG